MKLQATNKSKIYFLKLVYIFILLLIEVKIKTLRYDVFKKEKLV